MVAADLNPHSGFHDCHDGQLTDAPLPAKRHRASHSVKSHTLGSIYIAAGDDDFSARDIYKWLLPLLRGTDPQKWSLCLFEMKAESAVVARFVESGSNREHVFQTYWNDEECSEFRQLVPNCKGLVILLSSQNNSQFAVLIDEVSQWWTTCDPTAKELAALKRLFQAFGVLSPFTPD